MQVVTQKCHVKSLVRNLMKRPELRRRHEKNKSYGGW